MKGLLSVLPNGIDGRRHRFVHATRIINFFSRLCITVKKATTILYDDLKAKGISGVNTSCLLLTHDEIQLLLDPSTRDHKELLLIPSESQSTST